MEDFKSTNDLPFLSRYWNNPFNNEGWQEFKIGTCVGQWNSTQKSYQILSVINSEPGNGHLQDVFDWFENSCKRDGKTLRILDIINKDFAVHLKTKRGFLPEFGIDEQNLIKRFDQ